MPITVIFLDFYGTVVHEDGQAIARITVFCCSSVPSILHSMKALITFVSVLS